jgi:hypothetical protein
MRWDRFTVLFLAGLLAASLSPWPIPAVVTTCIEPADLGLADAGNAPSAIDDDAVVGGDAIGKTGSRPGVPASSSAVATASVLAPADCDPLGVHSGRAPPLG